MKDWACSKWSSITLPSKVHSTVPLDMMAAVREAGVANGLAASVTGLAACGGGGDGGSIWRTADAFCDGRFNLSFASPGVVDWCTALVTQNI